MRVLIAIEDEIFGKAIVQFVSSHVWAPGTIFKLIHAVEPTIVGDNITAIYGMGIENEILTERVKHGTSMLNRLHGELQKDLGQAMPVEVNVIIGTPHHTILETAEKWQADLIVLGSHGRKGFSRFLMGSVSLAVVSHANCSVSIVRVAKDAQAQSKEENSASKEKQHSPVA